MYPQNSSPSIDFVCCQEPEFTDKKVQAMKEYEYRVTATNEDGVSDPSEVSKAIKAKPLKGTSLASQIYAHICHLSWPHHQCTSMYNIESAVIPVASILTTILIIPVTYMCIYHMINCEAHL